MSGEMNTSLGNGLVNLIIINFICCHLHKNSVTCIVEGDDSLFCTTANVTSDDFISCGLTCLLEKHEKINTASFCGIIYHPYDGNIITDPIKVLLKTPYLPRKWCSSATKVQLQIMKCKALSIRWQYPGCPILISFANWILRETCHLQVRKSVLEYFKTLINYQTVGIDFDSFKKAYLFSDITRTTPNREIGEQTRLLMDEKFHIPVDYQLELEGFFDNQTSLEAYTHPLIYQFCKPDMIHNFQTHVFNLPVTTTVAEIPNPAHQNYVEDHKRLYDLLINKTNKHMRSILRSILIT